MTPEFVTRRRLLAGCAGAFLTSSSLRGAGAGDDFFGRRSFSVLSLLSPRLLRVRPVGNARLHCTSGDRVWVVEGRDFLRLDSSSPATRLCGPEDQPVEFTLDIPDVLRRRYRGVLRVSGDEGVLKPVVEMDAETAVSSVAGAELPVWQGPLPALAAQAIASRSLVLARTAKRHKEVDFCDTTHCQFLRSPAAPGSVADRATCETRGLVLVQDGRIVSAHFSRACGGRTEGGWRDGARYRSVQCEPCRQAQRSREGHGWGLCQQGALDLAQSGFSWRAILAKYYAEMTVAPASDSGSALIHYTRS